MRLLTRAFAVFLAAIFSCAGALFAEAPPTFGDAGTAAAGALLRDFYAGGGKWRTCDRSGCSRTNSDWGADAATGALYLRWRALHEAVVTATLDELEATQPHYGRPCTRTACAHWSDTPAWDAVAAMRAYAVTGRARDLRRAKAALAYAQQSPSLDRGACPSIPYQHPPQDGVFVKTLETTANAVKGDLLVYEATRDPRYLAQAEAGYAAARATFLDPALPLYTVHVIDDGVTCAQVKRRFFASVNGDMIWNGVHLARATGEQAYANDALQTARAVDDDLSDARGVFADVQGENDVVEPLVEAMLELAPTHPFARTWILRNAASALSARTADGSFPRFFDGPPQRRTSIWQANGGFALEIAAAALAPDGVAMLPGSRWGGTETSTAIITSLPATITVTGTGVALVGTMSKLCVHGHVAVLIDGKPLTDRTGLWQNPSMPQGPGVLFAWRWVEPGTHTITLEPGNPASALSSANPLDLREVLTRD